MIILSKEQFDLLVEHAQKVLPNEDCGLLGGSISDDAKTVKKIYFLTNTDASPEHFSMDAKEQFATVKDMRLNDLKLLGNFHSHPKSPARPSEEDKRLVFDTKLSYLILSLEKEPTLKSFTFDRDKNVFPEMILAPSLAEKLDRLKNYLRGLEEVAVAFSGGVNSKFLLKVAHDTLGDKAIALTATGKFIPRRDFEAAKKFCTEEKIRQIIFEADALNIPEDFLRFAEGKILIKGARIAEHDENRSVTKAMTEIKSPLRIAELDESEIFELSKALNLLA